MPLPYSACIHALYVKPQFVCPVGGGISLAIIGKPCYYNFIHIKTKEQRL